MILLIAVLLGLAAGLIRAWLGSNEYSIVQLQGAWLVFVAYLPQLFAFHLHPTQKFIADNWVPFILIGSQILLLIFVWLNRTMPGFWALGLGLFMNFLAIALNKGMMPLSPEIAEKLIPKGVEVTLAIGKRVGYGRDILLPLTATKLWFLGDIFTLPKWINYPLAFSIGDIFISLGAFWLLWSLGGPLYSSSGVQTC